MPTDKELDTEINDEAQSDDSRDEAQAPKSDRLNSQNQTYNFDATTVIIGMQILPLVDQTRQVLITVGIKGELPIVVNATLNQITQSTIIALRIEQLEQALPQIAQTAAKRAVASKTFNTIKAKIPVPELPVPSAITQSNQLSLFT